MSHSAHEVEANTIRQTIHQEEITLRKKHTFLKHQTEIGFGLWLGSILWVLGNAWLYSRGFLSAYAAVPLTAFPLSILHEIEHDIIHKQYFPSNRMMQDILLFFIWIFKAGHELSPYVRRGLHLHHHKRSGQVDDIEERLIGLGLESNLFKILLAFFPSLGIVVAYAPGWGIYETTGWSLIPKGVWTKEKFEFYCSALLINTPLLLGYLSYCGYEWASFLLVTWVGPNILRHACLVLLSSYSHYALADDSTSTKDITLQNQILNHWSLYPLQLFCCNFGAEHILHHYVIHQPFYIRHWCRVKAWKVMEENGVRKNDFGILWRGNRRS